MNTEKYDHACREYRDELLRCVYEAGVEPGSELQEHLNQCAACRELIESEREMVAQLEAALGPEPLPADAMDRILARAEEGLSRERVHTASWRWWAGSAAVAAGLLIALVWYYSANDGLPAGVIESETTEAVVATGEVEGSPESAAVLVFAEELLSWDGAESSAEVLAEQVVEVAETVDRRHGDSYLPWGPEDDWDLPVEESDTSQVSEGVLCLGRMCSCV